jgi:hypothetical protein
LPPLRRGTERLLIFNIVAEVDKVIDIYEEEAKKWAWIKIKEKKQGNDKAAAEAERNEDVYLNKFKIAK